MSNADTGYSANLRIYEDLVARQPDIRRKGKKNPYTAINGNMFSFLTSDGTICLRLSADDRKAFTDTFKTPPVVQYGAVMKEYVAVPETLLGNVEDLSAYFDQSVTYARSLKPKPTKR